MLIHRFIMIQNKLFSFLNAMFSTNCLGYNIHKMTKLISSSGNLMFKFINYTKAFPSSPEVLPKFPGPSNECRISLIKYHQPSTPPTHKRRKTRVLTELNQIAHIYPYNLNIMPHAHSVACFYTFHSNNLLVGIFYNGQLTCNAPRNFSLYC